ncbi:MAG: J domain-containing protein [Candidatus Omnitrophota bacterium]
MDFNQIDQARKVLGLGEEAGMGEIKEVFRNLSLKYHPDRCKDKDKKRCVEVFKKIANAKDIITAYCANYRYSFMEKDVNRNIIPKEQYEYLKRFYGGWIWNLDL